MAFAHSRRASRAAPGCSPQITVVVIRVRRPMPPARRQTGYKPSPNIPIIYVGSTTQKVELAVKCLRGFVALTSRSDTAGLLATTLRVNAISSVDKGLN